MSVVQNFGDWFASNTMAVLFNCPHCHAQTEVPDQYAGQTGPCRACGRRVRVPTAPTTTDRPLMKLPSILSSGIYGAIYAGLLTLFVVTLPEIGSPFGVLRALLEADATEPEYIRKIVGNGLFWLTATSFGAFGAAVLIAIIAIREESYRRLTAKRQGAGWGCAGGTLLALGVVLAWSWLSSSIPDTLTVLGRLSAILLCGLIGALLGVLRVAMCRDGD